MQAPPPELFCSRATPCHRCCRPPTNVQGYDFQDTSSGAHARTVKKVRRADFGADHDYEGGAANSKGRSGQRPWGGSLACGGWAISLGWVVAAYRLGCAI